MSKWITVPCPYCGEPYWCIENSMMTRKKHCTPTCAQLHDAADKKAFAAELRMLREQRAKR